MRLVVLRIDVQYNIWPWSANTPADHCIVFRRTIAGQKQGRRLKASSANETQRVRAGGFVRLQAGDLRRFCKESVGGAGQKRGTSDRFAGNVSEVLRLSGVQEVDVYEAVDFLDEFY